MHVICQVLAVFDTDFPTACGYTYSVFHSRLHKRIVNFYLYLCTELSASPGLLSRYADSSQHLAISLRKRFVFLHARRM